MPSIDKSRSQSGKKRLGRGLGSLLETGPADFEYSDDKGQKTAEKPQPEKKPTKEGPKPVPEVKEAAPKPAKPEQVELKNRILNLAIEKVEPNSDQPRKDFLKDPLDELSQSIKEQGVLQPITVRKKGEKYEIIAGERRWRATQLAGLKSIPAILKDVDDQRSMELAMIENLQRENLNPLEEAMGYQHLIEEHELSQQDLAKKIGKSRTAITNSLRLLVLPRDVREMLRQSVISVGHAKVLLGVSDPKEMTKLARKVSSQKLSVRALEREINKAKSPSADLSDDQPHQTEVRNLEQRLQKRLGTRVKIQYEKGKGQIKVNFYSDEELNGIIEKIRGDS